MYIINVMKIEVNSVRKRLKIFAREKKNENDVVGDVSYSIPGEILKFLILLFVALAFIMFQYQDLFFHNDNKVINIIRKIYLYSFGLAFGDIITLVIIGSFLTLMVRWFGSIFKNHYFAWFKSYTRVDYWILRKRIISFVWLTLLFVVLIYHVVLVSFRVENIWYYSTADVKNIYLKGWYYTFTNQADLLDGKSVDYPVAYLNIGFLLDTLFNLFYVVTFSPYLAIISAFLIWTLAWLFLVTLNPIKYFKNINEHKKTIVMVEQYLQKINSLFYYTPQVRELFRFYKDAAQVLKVDYFKFNFRYLQKLVKKNLTLLAQHTLKAKYFENVKAKKTASQLEAEEFLKIVETTQTNTTSATITLNAAADIKMPAINAQNLLVNKHNKNNTNTYISNESTSEYSKDFDLTEERYMSNYVETIEVEAQSQESTKLLIDDLENKKSDTEEIKAKTKEMTAKFEAVQPTEEKTKEITNILLADQVISEVTKEEKLAPTIEQVSQQFLVDTNELTDTNDVEKDQTQSNIIDQNNSKTVKLVKETIENEESKTLEQEIAFLIDSSENTFVMSAEKNTQNITQTMSQPVEVKAQTIEQKIEENVENKKQTIGFIIPEDSNETIIEKDDDLKTKEEFIAQLDSIEADNLASKEIKLEQPESEKRQNFQFTFDTNTIVINNDSNKSKDRVDHFEDDNDWVSPILSDN
ncbi:putative membrane protein [Mycoplasmopsis fermentans MF-I2]|nr:putative membrane protein [Mycoplasmopsis fermentans MF-I1]RMX35007.1 putative membrane protein [Mycoplasmopsis fermentans MF-I2]